MLQPVTLVLAEALRDAPERASRLLGASLPPGWPHPAFLDVLAARAAESAGGDHFGVWVLVDPAARAVVGDAGFKGPPGASHTVEIGYGVAEGWRGSGYAAEAARALTEWALSRSGVDAVVAHTDPANTASVRTLERAGFTAVGEEGGETLWRRVATNG